MSQPNQPHDQPLAEGQMVAAVVNLDQNIHSFAREAANNRLHSKMESGGFVGRLTKKIWYGNIARDPYLQRYTREAEEEIRATSNLYAHENFSATDLEVANEQMQSGVTNRFVSEYDEMLRQDEERRELDDEGEQGRLKTDIKQLIEQYATGNLTEETFQEEKLRLLHVVSTEGGFRANLERGNIYADNLLEIAKQVKARLEAGSGQVGVSQLLDNLKLVTGEAKVGASTEVRRNTVDKIVERASGRLFVNEATVGMAAAVVISASKWSARSLTGAVTRTVGLGVGSGLIAGLRENARFKEERGLHARDRALGRELSADDARRSELDVALYEARSAEEMRDAMKSMLHDDGSRLRDGFGENDFQDALAVIADAKARVVMSDREKADLIRFSSVDASEIERTEMMVQLCMSKVRLQEWFDNLPPDQQQNLSGDAGFEALLQSAIDASEQEIGGEMTERDKVFNKMKAKRVAKMAVTAAGVGAVIGLIAQEGVASFSGDSQGLIERLWQDEELGQAHQTILDNMANGDALPDGYSYEQVDTSGETATHRIGEHTKLKHDEAFSFVESENGYALSTPGGTVVDGIHFNDVGVLTPESRQLLEDHHFSVDATRIPVEHTSTKNVELGTQDFTQRHAESFTKTTRDGWFDNDTPAPVFDYNELRMDWGGPENSGVDAKGDYVFDVSRMTEDGSWHGGNEVDWRQEATGDRLKVAISLSADTQDQTFMIDVNDNGQAIIPKDSLVAKAFSVEDGQTVFHGKYAEVSYVTGVDADGTEHTMPLATVVGDGMDRVPDVIETKTTSVNHVYELRYVQPEVSTINPNVLVAPNIPIVPREALTPWKRREISAAAYYENGYEFGERARQAALERSPRLQRDPRAELNPGQELHWYERQMQEHNSPEYTQSVRNAIESSPELRDLGPETKAIVTIPVAAASESENIYKTLGIYAQQDDDALRSTKILLHVNWIDDQMNDSEKAAKVQKTRDEIERARRDFPQLSIATIESEWSREKINNGAYGKGLIGHVARKMYDVAMMSVNKGIAEGKISTKQDVLLIRNDADAQGMDRRYLSQMVGALGKHPESDVFTGAVRWETARHRDLPGFAFTTNFREVMHIAAHRVGVKVWPPTVGINAAVRMSTFAAVGGIGYDKQENGAGSDDLAIGGRINAARNGHGLEATYSTAQRVSNRTQRVVDRIRSSRRGMPYSGSESYGSESGSKQGDSYAYHRHIAGAGIDTKADRLEAEYTNGKTITNAWHSFDQGGHKERGAGLGERTRESLATEGDAVISRIEANLSAQMSEWFGNRAHQEAGLSMMVPTRGKDGKPMYQLKRSNGRVSFSFSPEGKKWVLNRLQRDSRGRYDSIGSRVRRQLYSEVTGAKTPASQQPRFVK